MRIGSTDAFTRVGEADWTACAQRLGLDPGMVLDRLRVILGQVPMALTTAAVNGQFEVPGFGQLKVPGLHGGSGLAMGGSVSVLGLSHAV